MSRKTTTATQTFTDAQAALDHASTLYEDAVKRLRKALQGFISGRQFHSRVRECYPCVRVSTQTVARADSRLTYGFVAGPGVYERVQETITEWGQPVTDVMLRFASAGLSGVERVWAATDSPEDDDRMTLVARR